MSGHAIGSGPRSHVRPAARKGAAAVVLALFASSPASAEPAPSANEPRDCFAEFEQGTAPMLQCVMPLRMSEQERAELKSGSRGYVENVSCDMTIKIARNEIEQAIAAADYVFESPAQPVVCTVTTPKSSFEVTATFAPKVTFKSDKAVAAKPGLGNVTGVSRIISWPIVQFVNRWPSIQSSMLQIINAYREHARKTGKGVARTAG
jgi:hypothetical protein